MMGILLTCIFIFIIFIIFIIYINNRISVIENYLHLYSLELKNIKHILTIEIAELNQEQYKHILKENLIFNLQENNQ